jgi:predicted ATPase/DNA-binding winged helix-turn-helix (wHTH) protein
MSILSEPSARNESMRTACYSTQPRGRLPGLSGTEPMSEECYEFAGFRLLPRQRTLLLGTERTAIGPRAFDVLLLLVSRAGTVVSLNELMRVVWPNVTVEEANLRVQMGILRKALSACEEANRAIETIPLRGYCFVLPVRHHPNGIALESTEPRCQRALPVLPNSIVGRDDAIQLVEAALDEHRLVTITGPGGIGKTTVAVATAERYAARFSGLIAFADLSAATDGSSAAQLLAETLKVPLRGDTIESLCEHLRERKALLILDTCEHLVDPLSELVELMLRNCSNLKLLATSREALRAAGEWTHRLPSLTFPMEGELIEKKAIANFSAVMLFVDRVQSTTRYEPQPQDLPIIAEICRRLDGIPLALEFAAARVADLGLRKMASHLNNCFAILTRGRRTALPRHRTLAAAFDWSYGLLSEGEQTMLSHIATFTGPFTAEDVIGSCRDGACRNPAEAFYGLYDKSLLAVEMTPTEPAFRLLTTTKAYVAEVSSSSRRLTAATPRTGS